MSDGPHRSLRMRPGWKKVAEFADRRAFSSEEVNGATAAAYSADWRDDVPHAVATSISEILCRQQDSLFRGDKVMQLEGLRRLAAGHGLGQLVIDCAVQQAINGGSSANAPVEAVAQALSVWGARHAREIEEHYCRKSAERRAAHVRTRIEQAVGSGLHSQLARQLLKLDGAKASGTLKQTGIDDGVRL